MKAKQAIQISIPSPCHENWEAMTAAEHGRFCGSCQKVVTDFTQMEDAEILRYFQEGKNLCGRFNNDQLNRPLQIPVEKPRYFISSFYKKIAAGLLFGIGFLNQSFAQQKKQSTTQQPVAATKKSKAPVIISGHLLDMQTGKPLEGMTILLNRDDFELQTKTNRWGGFTFSIPAKEQKGKAILSYNHFGPINEEISLEESNTELQLLCNEPDVLNEIVIKGKPPFAGEINNNNFVTKGAFRTDMLTAAALELHIRKLVVNQVATPNQLNPEQQTRSKFSFWYRISQPFKRKNK